MTTPNPEENIGTRACFPVSHDAVIEAYAFFDRPNHLDAHVEVVRSIQEHSPAIIDLIVNTGTKWGLTEEQQIGFTGGVAVGYKFLQTQATRNGFQMPKVSGEAINAYIADLEQAGNNTIGPYLSKRSDELELEDPYYHEGLRVCLQGNVEVGRNDQGYFTMLGGVMLYDMIKKEAYGQDLQALFSASGPET